VAFQFDPASFRQPLKRNLLLEPFDYIARKAQHDDQRRSSITGAPIIKPAPSTQRPPRNGGIGAIGPLRAARDSGWLLLMVRRRALINPRLWQNHVKSDSPKNLG
jgi:hypothetical protein